MLDFVCLCYVLWWWLYGKVALIEVNYMATLF